MNEESEARALRKTTMFHELSDKDALVAANDIDLVQLKPGETLFRQGDAGNSMFFVSQGQLEVRLSVPNAPDRVVSVVGPDAILGEMSLLLEAPRTATVVAVSEAELWQVSRQKFQESVSSNDRWANQFLYYMSQILATRLDTMNRELVRIVAAQHKEPTVYDADTLNQMFDHMFTNIEI